MKAKVTSKPLSRGRYRMIINGVYGKITKNPKRERYAILKAEDLPRQRQLKFENMVRFRRMFK